MLELLWFNISDHNYTDNDPPSGHLQTGDSRGSLVLSSIIKNYKPFNNTAQMVVYSQSHLHFYFQMY